MKLSEDIGDNARRNCSNRGQSFRLIISVIALARTGFMFVFLKRNPRCSSIDISLTVE